MIFASHVFLFWFLPLVLLLYAFSPRQAKSLLLVVASYVFYSWARADFAVLLIISTLVDYSCGLWLGRLPDSRRAARRAVLLVSVVVNLGLLAWFKYRGFGTEALGGLMNFAGLDVEFAVPAVILPVGISFYTFQSMSYTLDLYAGKVRPVRNLLDFACYVSLFPQLVCGPIVRYRDIEDQLRNRRHTFEKISRGVLLIQFGFAKKILLADPLGAVATASFALPDPTCAEAWLGTLAYTFQIYFDFSGYSDMAIGLGALLGFTFPVNFVSPYKATSITDFWRRWHVTLSSWLRDYLYIPLGGSRGTRLKTYRNLVLTFLLCGLWHGANWTFVAWGAYHGAWLILERVVGLRERTSARSLWFVPRVAATFLAIVVGWVFFRADDLGHAGRVLGAMADVSSGFGLEGMEFRALSQWVLGIAAAVAFLVPNVQQLARRAVLPWLAAPVVFVAALGQFFFESFRPFLYFQF